MQGKDIGKCLFEIIPSGCLTQAAALNRWLLKQVRLYVDSFSTEIHLEGYSKQWPHHRVCLANNN